MIAGAMVGWRNPARYIAPLALAAAVTATYLVVHHALLHKHSSTQRRPRADDVDGRPSPREGSAAPSKAKFYIVRPGDSLSGIAAKTGVSITTIEALNPHINPNALQPSQRSGCGDEVAMTRRMAAVAVVLVVALAAFGAVMGLVSPRAARAGAPATQTAPATGGAPSNGTPSTTTPATTATTPKPPPPPLDVRAAALIEEGSGQQLYGQNRMPSWRSRARPS